MKLDKKINIFNDDERPIIECKFNPIAIRCHVGDDCSKCGWNPEVAKKRKEKQK